MKVLVYPFDTQKTRKYQVFKYIVQENYLLGNEGQNENQLRELIAGTRLATKSYDMVSPAEHKYFNRISASDKLTQQLWVN